MTTGPGPGALALALAHTAGGAFIRIDSSGRISDMPGHLDRLALVATGLGLIVLTLAAYIPGFAWIAMTLGVIVLVVVCFSAATAKLTASQVLAKHRLHALSGIVFILIGGWNIMASNQ